jgi:hypothetical protein
MCNPTTYGFLALPEQGYAGSEPRAATCHDGDILVVGRVCDTGIDSDHIMIWRSTDGGETFNPSEPSAPTPSAGNDIACVDDGEGLCIVVGEAGDPRQPTAWENTGDGWILVTLPTGGATGGRAASIVPSSTYNFAAVGYVVGADGFNKATRWERDEFGTWTVSLLPDFGDGRHSRATSVAVCPEGVPELCEQGTLFVGGVTENVRCVGLPTIWVEQSPGSGSFVRHDLLLPDGANGGLAGMVVTDVQTNSLMAVGAVTLNSGKEIGIVWTNPCELCTTTILPPLAGYPSSTANTLNGPHNADRFASGASFPTGEDPLTSGRATMWHANFVGDEVYLTDTTDLNDLVSGLPDAAQLTTVLGLEGVEDCNANCLLGTYVFSQPGRSRDILPHAKVLFAQPRAIPAVSEWGMVAMTLLVLAAGTIVFMRRRQERAQSSL